MIRVSARAVADEFSVDGGGAGKGVGELFEDEDPGAFADDEAGAVAVEGPGGEVGGAVVGCGEAAGARETGDGEGVDAGFGGAGEHDGGVAVGDEAGGVADGVRTGGAGGCGGVVGALWRGLVSWLVGNEWLGEGVTLKP
jgi:hypothetical protein